MPDPIAEVVVTDNTVVPTVIEVQGVALAGFDRDKLLSVEFGADRSRPQFLRLATMTDELHQTYEAAGMVADTASTPFVLPTAHLEPLAFAHGGVLLVHAAGEHDLGAAGDFIWRLRATNDSGTVTLLTGTITYGAGVSTGHPWDLQARVHCTGPAAQMVSMEIMAESPLSSTISVTRFMGSATFDFFDDGDVSLFMEIEVDDSANEIRALAYNAFQAGVKDGVLY